MTAVTTWIRRAWRNNGSAMLWAPVLLLIPLLGLDGNPLTVAVQVGLVLVIAGCAVVIVLHGRPGPVSGWVYFALSTQVSATFGGAQHGAEWLPTWILLALVLPSVVNGRWLGFGIVATAIGAMWAAWFTGASVERSAFHAFPVLLAGIANAVFLRLINTVEELHRTREELARRAVAEERDRFSRDLHDLLGHTLSVMVVKAQAVRRLAERDPRAAASHAEDIEQVGRTALLEVREAVDATRASTMDDELVAAERALDAAGIRTRISRDGRPVDPDADRALAWVVREAVTNVLRHSGAGTCSIAVRRTGAHLALTVKDDGVGGPVVPAERQGGLDGLRRRLGAVGGWLEAGPHGDGFLLTAQVPATKGER